MAPPGKRRRLHPLERGVAQFVALRSGGARVGLVALVSGGKDSVALLRALAAARLDSAARGGIAWELAVFHADHGLRGEESATDARFVLRTALELGLPAQVSRWSPPSAMPEGLQSTARAWRHSEALAFARKCAGLWDLAPTHLHLVTGHHAQDHVESVLLNLLRGTGLAGLRGIAEVSDCGRWWRPFAQISPEEIAEYASEKGIQHREDPSNATEDYDRNILRHRVLPVLRELRPHLEESFLRVSRNVSEALKNKASAFPSEECSNGPFAERSELHAWALARLREGSQAPSGAAIANLWDHAQRSFREPGRRLIVTVKGLGSVSFQAGIATVVS